MAVTADTPVSAGNLKAVVEKLMGGGSGSIADVLYPVGSIYLSTSSTSPQTLFGGTWQRIQDRFLLCAGSTYAAGKTGGEAEHTLTVNEMPSHTHQALCGGGSADNGFGSGRPPPGRPAAARPTTTCRLTWPSTRGSARPNQATHNRTGG